MRIFLPFTTLRNLRSSSFFTIFLSNFFLIANYLSCRGGLLLCFPDRFGLPSPYTLPLHLVCVALFSPFVQFCSSTALLTEKKISLSLLRLLLGSTSRESQQCTFSMNNIGSRSMHYLPLSLSLKCVPLVSADLLKKLWTGA